MGWQEPKPEGNHPLSGPHSGVADRLGALEKGLDATCIITHRDPLEVTTQVEGAYSRGRPVDLSSKHTRLYEKYPQRYQQLRDRPIELLQ